MKNTFIILCIGLFSSFFAIGQQLVNPTQMRWVYDINPAVIGFNENVSICKRQVFSGLDGAPSLQFLSLNKLTDNNMGVGLQVYDGSQGFVQNRGIKTGYMYRVHLNESNYLAFGISVDLFQKLYKKELYNLKNLDDPAFTGQQYEQMGIDFDAGLSFNTPNFYADLAVHQVPGRSVSLLNDFAESKRTRHYFLNLGYRFYLNNDIIVEPNVFFKTIEQFVFHVDAGLKFVWDETLWLGAYYRTNQFVAAMAGFKLDRYGFGFAYDYGFQDVFNYSTGTWEFQFIYDLHQSKRKHM